MSEENYVFFSFLEENVGFCVYFGIYHLFKRTY